jgi:methionyl-tRNA synthetase
MRELMNHADRINQDFDAHQPWVLAKDPNKRADLKAVCSRALAGFKLLSVLLSPVLPQLAARVARELFGLGRPFAWSDAEQLPTRVNPYQHLMTRVDPKQLDALFETDKSPAGPAPKIAAAPAKTSAPAAAAVMAPAAKASVPNTPPPASISIDEFMRIDLRIARIIDAGFIDGADKLLRLRLDVGELGEREIFAGIRAAYDPKSLIGRLIVVVANLEPRKMRFGTSAGMALAAGPGGAELFVVSPDSGAKPGMRVK